MQFTESQIAAAARALSDNHAKVCNIDKEDNWKFYSESFIGEARIMALVLATTSTEPAAQPAHPDLKDLARLFADASENRKEVTLSTESCALLFSAMTTGGCTPPAPSAKQELPAILFDGHAVYKDVMANDPNTPRPTPDNVANVLDSVVRLMRKSATPASASASPAAPGFVLVPVVPTPAMIEAAAKADDAGFEAGRSHGASGSEIYAAMLAASPAAAVAAPTEQKDVLAKDAQRDDFNCSTVQGYIQFLAWAIWRDHYQANSPNFCIQGDAVTALSQIDNMVTGLTRKPAAPVAGSQHVPRADLEAINTAMQHMGDALNKIDAVEAEDEEVTKAGFDAIARALAAAAPAVPVPEDQDQVRDAARYRWLRSDDIELVPGQREICVYLDRLPFREDQTDELLTGSELDDAVDAAMAAPSLQQPKEGAAS